MSIQKIIIHGRGGQGAVMMAQMLAYAAVLEGYYACAIPDFTFERRGAPVKSFLRIDREVIREKTFIYDPNCVIVLDPSTGVNFYEGLQPNSYAVINKGSIVLDNLPSNITRVGFVDANSIALQYIGMPIPNTTMMGAFAKTTGLVSLRSLEASIKEFLPEHLHERNIMCLKEGYRQTKTLSR